METPKQCKRCGSLGPFHKNKNTHDGLQSWCKICKKDSNTNQDYAAINRRRRADPVYREKERKRAAELDKQRRKVDLAYSKRRYFTWLRTVKPESVVCSNQAHNERRRAARRGNSNA